MAVERDADEIDELVDYELTLPRWAASYDLNAQCGRCGKEWHGLMRGICPGETGIVGSKSEP